MIGLYSSLQWDHLHLLLLFSSKYWALIFGREKEPNRNVCDCTQTSLDHFICNYHLNAYLLLLLLLALIAQSSSREMMMMMIPTKQAAF